eukprot:TRINITY_DN25491_c0_g1_i1.p2 TRINITY_DN25491_c0_g1~~TRINITY_DN25491_c0_g1_i1.p2  ORF type:complete len:206 (+),score=24.81 TRINITY_DN25491_c0_g1_i1:240-857(+)
MDEGSRQGVDCPDRQAVSQLRINDQGCALGFTKFGRQPTTCSIVMDFDLTITSVHVWNTLARTGEITANRIPGDLGVDYIFGGPARLGELERFFTTLHSRGAQVMILTNNYRDVVEKCLREANLDRFVPDIIGREQPGTKGQIVSSLREKLKATNKGLWMFVDDDPHNVRNVHLATQGTVATLHVDGGSGMQMQHLQKILSMLEK